MVLINRKCLSAPLLWRKISASGFIYHSCKSFELMPFQGDWPWYFILSSADLLPFVPLNVELDNHYRGNLIHPIQLPDFSKPSFLAWKQFWSHNILKVDH